MATSREVLEEASANLEESMGVRSGDPRPRLAPVALGKDVGRSPNLKFGRVRIDQVIADPQQPRSEFSQDALERLAQSIREKGQLLPIRVRWSDGHQKWIIISGERRWRAACEAGLAEIDCFFDESPLSLSEILEQQLIENCLREDLQPIEEARAFSKLIALNHWTGKQLAEALRLPPSRVSRALALLRLPVVVQEQVETGEVSARAAYELSKLKDPDIQSGLSGDVARRRLNLKQTQRAVQQRRGKHKHAPRGTRQTFFTEEGWTVTVSSSNKGTYHDVEKALTVALDEVQHRIQWNRQL